MIQPNAPARGTKFSLPSLRRSRRLTRSLLLTCAGLALTGGVASATTVPFSGTFMNDASVFSDSFTVTSAQNYTFTTTSYAAGGIVPVLTLFNFTTGKVIDFSGADTGFADVTLTDLLSAGSYVLDLTEFPNSAVGPTLAAGFYPNDPTITGTDCSVSGGMFYNDVTCTKTTNVYSGTITNTAATTVTPEPSTLLLVLPPALALFGSRRRRSA